MPDHDRPLNQRGEHDAPRIAAALRQRGVVPDRIVTSTAKRAKSTAEILAAGMGFPPQKVAEAADLYHASPETILTQIQQLEEGPVTVCLFGHNPGMHEAVVRLTNDPGVREFPTLAVARVEFDVEYWGEVEWGSGLLLELLTPRMLKSL